MYKLKKAVALFIAIVMMMALTVACGTSTAQEPPKDPDAEKAEFLATVNSKQIENVEGVEQKNILETTGNVYISAMYPSLMANEAVSGSIKAFVDKQVADFNEEVATTEENDTYQYMLTYKPYLNGSIFSVKFSKNSYTGKIDRKNYVDGFVYNLNDGKKLELTDVFDANTDYLNTISALAKEYLLRNEVVRQSMDEAEAEALFEKGTAPEIQNYSNFVVCADKLIFFFNRNTVAAGEVGTLEVSIPLTAMQGVLKPEITALFAVPTAQETQDPQDPNATPLPEGEATPPVASGDLPEMLKGDANVHPAFSIEGFDINDKYVALTFDDGPSKSTPHLLETLKANNGVATFFVVGSRVEEYADTMKAIVAGGNEIANHSYNHNSYTKASTDYQKEVSSTDDVIEKTTGKRSLMGRPPGGAITEEIARDLGKVQILWDVDPLDWKDRDAATVAQRVLEKTTDGSVVLMHDLHATTVDACDTIIPELAKKGYKFVTVSQMMQIAKARGKELTYVFNNGKWPKETETTTEPNPTYDVEDANKVNEEAQG